MTKLFSEFFGELGWQLFGHQAYIRNMSNQYDEVIIASRPGTEYLYEDFCHKFISYDPNNWETDGWLLHGWKYPNLHEKYIDIRKDTLILAKRFDHLPQKFIKFGEYKENLRYDILIHARNTNKVRTGIRNWSENKWVQLINILKDKNYLIGSIGTSEGALYIQGTNDLRDIPLKELCNYIASSRLIIGPSSGPMHLASLCGTRHLVWGEARRAFNNKDRYEKIWNPLKTPVKYLDEYSWDPPVDFIYNNIAL